MTPEELAAYKNEYRIARYKENKEEILAHSREYRKSVKFAAR